MKNREALQRAVDICGGQRALSRKIGVPQQTISFWLNLARELNPKYAPGIEVATDYQVRKEELCPEVFGSPPTDEGRAA